MPKIYDNIEEEAIRLLGLSSSLKSSNGIESIILLRKRLTNRIKENAEVVGSDETFFEGDPVSITD